MGDDDLIRRGDAKAAFACETAYGRGVRAKLSYVPAASSKLVKREEIQRNRDEAYQVGWGDGYAEGYGKARPAADARAEALHPDAMLPEAIRLIRNEASRDHAPEKIAMLRLAADLCAFVGGEHDLKDRILALIPEKQP